MFVVRLPKHLVSDEPLAGRLAVHHQLVVRGEPGREDRIVGALDRNRGQYLRQGLQPGQRRLSARVRAPSLGKLSLADVEGGDAGLERRGIANVRRAELQQQGEQHQGHCRISATL